MPFKRPSARQRVSGSDAENPEAAGRAAVALLSRRDFSSGELSARLAERGFEAAVVTAVIAELAERRLIDDARYAGHFVSYHAERGQGPLRIRRDLAELGLSQSLIDESLAEGPDWHALARELRIRKFGLKAPGSWSEKARQARFLQYRGFTSDHIRSALNFEPESTDAPV